ncbi:MAG: hypothetical protein ABIK66_06725 [candidate division WOR-3 bacterium]
MGRPLINKLIDDLEGRYDVTDPLFIKRLSIYAGFYIYDHYNKLSDYEKDSAIFMLSYPSTNEIKIHTILPKNIVLVGLGGIGMNFVYWSIIKGYWYSNVIIFENDKIELQNCIRMMPFNPFGEVAKIFLAQKIVNIAGLSANFVEKRFEREDMERYKGYIIIGAPDISTRNWVAESGERYIYILHQNDKFFIFSNLAIRYPRWSADAPIVETYGKIKLDNFFDNMNNIFWDALELIENSK